MIPPTGGSTHARTGISDVALTIAGAQISPSTTARRVGRSMGCVIVVLDGEWVVTVTLIPESLCRPRRIRQTLRPSCHSRPPPHHVLLHPTLPAPGIPGLDRHTVCHPA